MDGILLFRRCLNNNIMEDSVNKRIEMIYAESKEKSIRSYALKRGIPPTTLNECIKGAEPRYSLLRLLLDGEPSISAEWLLRGKGEMYLQSGDVKTEDLQFLKEKIIRLEAENKVLREVAGLHNDNDKVTNEKTA